ncbi:ATP-binding cassette domain-containing protein [Lampropedia puyangensis]|uniref:ATP-binding cassette domain-containing protein n=1 Tax=Lampropedia puyangensis TaxID=1330072 RepID=A0A4S8EZ99_9BURK|nr:ATP-binding cassette domain-containing protein [Lampropedia puyangensis]THT99938.1 ATP-binding cassette domain-containing protein [Lampropedia puyangensis]
MTTPQVRNTASLTIETLHYPAGDSAALLRLTNWNMAPGVHGVHGESGSGKTMLLNLLAGKPPASSAFASIALQDVAWGSKAWPAQVFCEDPNDTRWDAMSGHDVLAYLLQPAKDEDGRAWSPHRRSQDFLLNGLGLHAHLHKTMYMLSTGTRRKVFLLAALLSPRPLVLLDEPTAALDQRSIQTLWYALAVRNRAAHQITLVATAAAQASWPTQPWRGHWQLP